MNRRTLISLLVLALVSILGIIVVQMYWVRRAFDVHQKQYEQRIQIALQKVAQQVAEYGNSTLDDSPINQLASDYYIVSVNCEIDAALLEFFLKKEFAQRNIQTDFEYGIYDCNSEKMVYGNYVESTLSINEGSKPNQNLPKWEGHNYYFGIRFPMISGGLVAEMDIWIFLSLILLLVIVFLIYGLFFVITQRQFSLAQKQFINNITHELKTPMSILRIASQVITNPQADEERKKQYATIVNEQTNRLDSQIEKLLQLLMLERNSYVPLNLQLFSINELINESIKSFELEVLAMGSDKEVKIILDLPQIDIKTKVDKIHFQNMLHNFLENAVKYNQNAPTITVSLQKHERKCTISIRDNGIGIDKKFQKRIFEKFFRTPTGDTHEIKGFGLGLSYCKQVIKAHHWKLSVNSELSKGSEFCIEIRDIL